MAIVSHGDEQAELPLLWQLCLALVNFGYTVTVLDATTAGIRVQSRPGTAAEKTARWSGDEDRQPCPGQCSRPQRAFKALCAHPTSTRTAPLPSWDACLQGKYRHSVLQSRMDDSAAWRLSNRTPASRFARVKTSLLTSYLALKRLLITGKLKPTIVNMIPSRHLPVTSNKHASSVAGLRECAKTFLGYETKVLDIAEQHST